MSPSKCARRPSALSALERIEAHNQGSRSYIARLDAQLDKRRAGGGNKGAGSQADPAATGASAH